LFVLPESLPKAKRSARFKWADASPLGSLKLLRSYPQVFRLAAVVFIANLAHYVYPSVFVLFADFRYGWGQTSVGYVLAGVGVLSVIVNVVVVGWVVKRFGERRAQLIGLGFGIAGFTIYAFANQGWIFLIGLPISSLWAIAGPASQALITKEVGAEVQGRIQGALSSLMSLAGIIGPTIYAGSFGYFISAKAPVTLPGIPFFIAAVLLVCGFAVAWQNSRSVLRTAKPELTKIFD
jgi:MFS transporter, DHA1 family, tetracycline resistance protein